MDNQDLTLSIAETYTVTPGPRYKDEGDFSGEQFREDFLEPLFARARNENKKLVINLDGTLGYGTSFLEEVFGGLARNHKTENVFTTLVIVSNEEPYLVNDIQGYINDANT
jgi:STAS-like domain of unknown function (DUF4325)